MNKRTVSIIYQLSQAREAESIRSLADQFHVSSRTIQGFCGGGEAEGAVPFQ